jgi:hypothetical protein
MSQPVKTRGLARRLLITLGILGFFGLFSLAVSPIDAAPPFKNPTPPPAKTP